MIVLAVVMPMGTSRAEVLDVRGRISSEVTEQVDGQIGSTDRAFEDLPQTLAVFPIEAVAGLGDFTGEQGSSSGGRGVASLSDPQSAMQRNPGELGLEAEAFSIDPSVAYDAAADATEVRRIVFTAQELETDQPRRVVSSSVFLRGAAVLWTRQPGRDLTGMSVSFDFRIIRDTGTNGGEVVFETGFEAVGSTGSAVVVTRGRDLTIQTGPPSILVDRLGDVVAPQADALGQIGDVQLVLLEPQELFYTYEATAGEPFELRAETRVRAVNLADGTGAGIALGRPFASLGLTIDPFTDQMSAESIQDVINDVISGTGPPDGNGASPGPPAGPPSGLVNLCGLFGAEMMLAPLGLVTARRMRRHHARCRSGGSGLINGRHCG